MHGPGHRSLVRSLSSLPQQQVDKYSNAEERSPDGGVPAEEENEVAEETEKDHPHHVQLEEQVKNIEPTTHGAQMLHIGRKPCPHRNRRIRKVNDRPYTTNRQQQYNAMKPTQSAVTSSINQMSHKDSECYSLMSGVG